MGYVVSSTLVYKYFLRTHKIYIVKVSQQPKSSWITELKYSTKKCYLNIHTLIWFQGSLIQDMTSLLS